MRYRVLITAGGTCEPIDDVRVVTNRATGRFGSVLAEKFAEFGAQVTLVTSKTGVRPRNRQVRVLSYESFSELRGILMSELEVGVYQAILMSAAVADYSPEPVVGKLSSEHDELTIVQKRNPKLLDQLRHWGGSKLFVVGFKLLSGSSEEQLLNTARKQISGGKVDLVVANDLQSLYAPDESQPFWIIDAQGGREHCLGVREDTALRLVERVMLELDCRNLPDTENAGSLKRSAETLGERNPTFPPEFTRGANVSGLPKLADLDLMSEMFERIAGLSNIIFLDFAEHVFLPAVFGEPVIDISDKESFDLGLFSFRQVRERGSITPFIANLTKGNKLLGMNTRNRQSCAESWASLILEYREVRALMPEWKEMGDEFTRATGLAGLLPVWAGGTIVGGLVRVDSQSVHPIVLQAFRGQGLGEEIAYQIAIKGWSIVLEEGCPAISFYEKQGFWQARRGNLGVLLKSPSQNSNICRAATVTLLDLGSGHLLLGRRKLAPYQDFYAFPGGKVNAEETSEICALRELEEETGIRLKKIESVADTDLFVGVPGGECSYLVRNFLIPVTSRISVEHRDEFEGSWMSLENASSKDLAPGVRRVITKVNNLYFFG